MILVERLGYLGGLATGGLIALLLTLDDGRDRQVIDGLCQEITDRLQKRGTVGRRIAALEEQLHTKLLSRTPDGLALTSTGQTILKHCETMQGAALASERMVAGMTLGPRALFA